ncbi:alginate export family protein [Pseudoxanthomonas sacheonensis]|uniref:Alginate export domain-containing protein n=1 Tax=Pseudoxanthomonas sacheonensis TaxID=443615 RepID=A0ABU1RSV9_9GAMM|nr:alginate export family protein [Pseudoxanthomonas sacheonensis]MDR6841861.1 hypothetical protein [Pseudoxanthomonas sacheonensis]
MTSGLLLSAPALAAETTIKPIVDLRLRHEGVEQAGLARDAEAITLRARAGAEISNGVFAFLAEAEGTAAIDERYNSGLNGKTAYPLVADPENIELNRVQVQYKGFANTMLSIGRQRINLDDQRFVGAAGWRDNEQTFDAARVEWTGPGQSKLSKLKLDASYAWSVRTIWGKDGVGARQQAIGGDNFFGNLSYPTAWGTLSGFAYLIDQDEAAVSGRRLSSQTYGVRLAGARPLAAAKLNYALSYAGQSDYHNNPNHYSAEYWLADTSVDVGAFRLGAGYEVLGADAGLALTSFQTPLATAHKFQGWADKFLTTPPNGVRDQYFSFGWNRKQFGKLSNVSLNAVWHRFGSDRLSQDYGDELNLIATAKIGKFNLLAKHADYRADQFATDTRKTWLQVEWSY